MIWQEQRSSVRTGAFNDFSTVPGSVARPATEITYDSSTGLVTDTKATGSSTSVSRTYDGWGREKTYKNDQNEVTSTTYNTAGHVSSVTDPKGSTSYSYDGTDAKGKTEHRGLVTELKVSRGNGQGDLTYTGAYDPDGNLTKQGMPGQLATEYTYDPAGQLTDLTYTGQVTPVTEETDPDTGETTWTPGTPLPDQPWLSWSRRYDITGRVTAEWNGAGTAYEGIPGVTDPGDIQAPSVGQGLAADKRYIYDFAGRLTRVDDRTAANTGITLDPDTGGDPQAPCVRRDYSFDKNGNRTKLKTSSSTGGNCFYATLDSETDFTYDALDRPLKASDGEDYEYDSFGRQTLIPEADAPVNNAGDISVTYFDDDLAREITQDGVTTTFELDALARRTTSTITNNPTVTRHYGDDSDNPAWTTNSDGAVMRNAGSLDGLGAIVFGDGSAALTIGNPHGDNVTTVILPVGHAETTAAVSINGWADYDEYGVTKSNYPQGVTYGWLGKHERSASIESAGLTLMGVRLYNPIRGAFTSVDPVRGGNTTAYTYPQDPINMVDLDGRFSWFSSVDWASGNLWVQVKFIFTKAGTIRAKTAAGAAGALGAMNTAALSWFDGVISGKNKAKFSLSKIPMKKFKDLVRLPIRSIYLWNISVLSGSARAAQILNKCLVVTGRIQYRAGVLFGYSYTSFTKCRK